MKNIILIFFATFIISATYAQVGINADNSAPHSSAILDVKSTTKAFYPPRMKSVQKNNMVGVAVGAVVYDTDLNGLFAYNGTSWVSSGFTLPYSTFQNYIFHLFRVQNTNTTTLTSTILGETTSNNTMGGVEGVSLSDAPSGNPAGVIGRNYSSNANGYGVYGKHEGIGVGVYGESAGTAIKGAATGGGTGGFFNSLTGYALITDAGKVGIGTLTPTAKMDIKGSANLSQFYLGANEDTYLRGGKSSSHMIINDTGDKIGLGTLPVLRGEEKVDINGRLRIRSSVAGTAGVWFNNTGNSISTANGAFYGMVNDTETGIWIGDAWRFWVNANGNVTSTSLAGIGTRPVYANNSGTLTAAPTSQTLILQPSDFQTSHNASTVGRYETLITFTSAGQLVAPIKLPIGAVINSVTMRAKDAISSDFISCTIKKLDTITNLATFVCSVNSPFNHSDVLPANWQSSVNLPHTIDAQSYYYINVAAYDSSAYQTTWNSGTNFDLRWIKIDYTY